MSTVSYRQRKIHGLYKILCKYAPTVPDELKKRSESGPIEIAHMLDSGWNSVRACNIHDIRGDILYWHEFEPRIDKDHKSLRGFNHPECGCLLCPASYHWEDPAVHEGLCNGSKNYPAGASDWPSFLWENEETNQEDLIKGFLHNELLIKALRHILWGPSAGRAGPTLTSNGGSKKNQGGSHKLKVMIYRIRSITVGSIAYSVMVVHFLLSSQGTMSVGGDGGKFLYGEFYHRLVKFMEQDMTPAQLQTLLDYWTTEVLGNEFEDSDSDADIENTAGHMSIAARMRAQQADKNWDHDSGANVEDSSQGAMLANRNTA
ncbi:hypothetical protein SCP_1202710 [Sparassis crispa]|uniref:Uncharacterized protein n=1 Tax=Sparassis crispa TaxID=139825 RepID=A0A401H0X1_9APHY|nr:hypothetical protein SCP_1202710 [Sparassis crispa]GBE88043.1 hypothetical protein SCP_1202710 [Sparassis crispa]